MIEHTMATKEQTRHCIMVDTPIEPADLAFVFGTRHGITNFADEITSYCKRNSVKTKQSRSSLSASTSESLKWSTEIGEFMPPSKRTSSPEARTN
jgi:hypothetical protein